MIKTSTLQTYLSKLSCFYHIRDLRRIRRYILLSDAKTIATALISSRLDYYNVLLNNIAVKDITKLQGCNNHCIGSVCDIALFLRFVQLPIKPFQSNNLHIYIRCSLQQDSPDSFCRLVLISFLFPELRQTLELELSRLPHERCGIHSLFWLFILNFQSY